jgi:hypothetical protein
MAIANAVQQGAWGYVYNETTQQLFTQSAGSGHHDGLKGYSSDSVTIHRGSWLYSTNDYGQQTGTSAVQ